MRGGRSRWSFSACVARDEASAPSHNGPGAQRSTPLTLKSMCSACARRPGPRAEIVEACSAAAALHLGDAFERLQSTNQDTSAYARHFGTDVEHEVVAVREVDVGAAALQIHHLVSWRRASVVVRGRIFRRVGLCFDDASGHSQSGKVADDELADQISRQRHRADRQLRPAQAPDRCLLRSLSRCFGWLSTHGLAHLSTIRPKYRFEYPPASPETCICRYVQE